MITCIPYFLVEIRRHPCRRRCDLAISPFSCIELLDTVHLLLRCVMSRDSEDCRAEIHYVKGYPSFAGFINSDCDKSTAIYRRFGRLSARNLLYLQSELVELEARQDALDTEYLHGTLEDKKSARNWQTLKRKAAEPGNTGDKDRVELLEEIRKKIKEYRTIPFS